MGMFLRQLPVFAAGDRDCRPGQGRSQTVDRTLAGDGGYYMVNGAVLDEAKPENLHAYVDTAKEYGVNK